MAPKGLSAAGGKAPSAPIGRAEPRVPQVCGARMAVRVQDVGSEGCWKMLLIIEL